MKANWLRATLALILVTVLAACGGGGGGGTPTPTGGDTGGNGGTGTTPPPAPAVLHYQNVTIGVQGSHLVLVTAQNGAVAPANHTQIRDPNCYLLGDAPLGDGYMPVLCFDGFNIGAGVNAVSLDPTGSGTLYPFDATRDGPWPAKYSFARDSTGKYTFGSGLHDCQINCNLTDTPSNWGTPPFADACVWAPAPNSLWYIGKCSERQFSLHSYQSNGIDLGIVPGSSSNMSYQVLMTISN